MKHMLNKMKLKCGNWNSSPFSSISRDWKI